MQRNFINAALSFVVAAALSAACSPAMADWDPNNPADVAKAKWIQLPDLTTSGMDVLDTLQPTVSVDPQWKILADDFQCTQSGPITDAHIWGSWFNNILPTNAVGLADPGLIRFKLSFHEDVPVSPTNPFSHPGLELWRAIFEPSQIQVRHYATANERFYDPNLDQVIGSDNEVFQYNFPNLVDANGVYFEQELGKIYWFDVQAEVLNTPGTEIATFGWKTAVGPHRIDDAVFADTDGFAGPLLTPWTDMHYPLGGPLETQSFDLSFVLTVPEPSSIAMAGLGIVALVGMVYRRKARQS